MKIFYKEWEQLIAAPLETVWTCFSRPENLNKITPPDMQFQILSDIKDVEMYAGMLIRYKVTPLLGIKMNWVTEIREVEREKYFIDEQRFGPYKLWHHQHHFEETEGGILMTDKLHYAIPMGPIGRMMNGILVDGKIESIFKYRVQAVDKLFPNKGV